MFHYNHNPKAFRFESKNNKITFKMVKLSESCYDFSSITQEKLIIDQI